MKRVVSPVLYDRLEFLEVAHIKHLIPPGRSCPITISITYEQTLNKAIRQQIELVPVPANIGRGYTWYFVCGSTGKKARKLYLYNDIFLHREAIKGACYSCQKLSKKARRIEKLQSLMEKASQAHLMLKSMDFKKYYGNKLTRKFKKIMKLKRGIEESNITREYVKELL